MRAYSSMPTSEFVNQLRDIAIRAGAKALVIDRLDAIVDGPSEEEIEERCTEQYDLGQSSGRDTQWNICFDMLDNQLTHKRNKALKFTAEQSTAIKEWMQAIRPE